jgi:sugar phosphate isomerase/epimerase
LAAVADPKIVLSTGSFFPNTELGFRMAAEHGFDGVEVMVTHDRRSQTIANVEDLVTTYGVPVTAVHVPCLVVTQHVWGWNPEGKLRRAVEMATSIDASTVVTHPPFRWQREYAGVFADVVRELDHGPGPTVTVENMYAVDGPRGLRIEPYLGNDDGSFATYESLTLDSSHVGAARQDLLERYSFMRGRVRHLHLSDSTSTKADEHLPPGDGTLPLRDLADAMVADGFDGQVVLEVAIGRLPDAARSAATGACATWARDAFGTVRRT